MVGPQYYCPLSFLPWASRLPRPAVLSRGCALALPAAQMGGGPDAAKCLGFCARLTWFTYQHGYWSAV